MHKCQHCKSYTSTAVRNGTQKLSSGEIQIRYMCRPCNKRRFVKYYNENKERCRAILYKSIDKHSEKQTARMALARAIRAGHMDRPDKCERCAQRCKPHGHHEDYSKPLEVVWVCSSCHADLHADHRSPERQHVV